MYCLLNFNTENEKFVNKMNNTIKKYDNYK